jgi:hypothetical protein
MKNVQRIVLGLVTSLFLSVGLIRAAEWSGGIPEAVSAASASPLPAPGCNSTCSWSELPAPGCNSTCSW